MADVKQVIVIRRDLKMRRGKEIAQGAHASMKVLLDARVPSPDGTFAFRLWPEAEEWLRGRFTKITLQAQSEEELLDLHRRAQAAGLPCALIRDAGHTEFGGVPTYTALAIGPSKADDLAPLTADLKLY